MSTVISTGREKNSFIIANQIVTKVVFLKAYVDDECEKATAATPSS